MRPAWYPDWSGAAAAVIASGASAAGVPIGRLRGAVRTIVVNNSWQLAPWAELLYAADGRWWDAYPAARDFAGLKVTAEPAAAQRHGLHRVTVLEGEQAHRISTEPGVLGHGGHGGFQAINLAVQLGARTILLVGIDLQGEHWHGDHQPPLRNPKPGKLALWRDRLDAQAGRLAELGVEILVASPGSALTAYRRASLEEALAA